MFSLPVFLLFQVAFLPSTLTLILHSSQVLSTPLSSPNSIHLNLPTTSNTTPNANAAATSPPSNGLIFECNDRYYGHDLHIQSCLDALNGIPWKTSIRILSLGARGAGHYDVQLPFRMISLDGLCALDIVFAPHASTPEDEAEGAELGADIASLMGKCVMLSHGKGGIAIGAGGRGNLALIVRSYVPSVTCVDIPYGAHAPARDACRALTDEIPVGDGALQRFGDGRDPRVQVKLPIEFFDHTSRCTALAVTPSGGSDISSWYEVWTTAIAIEGMCVRQGKAGRAAFGMSHLLDMAMEAPLEGTGNATA